MIVEGLQGFLGTHEAEVATDSLKSSSGLDIWALAIEKLSIHIVTSPNISYLL